VILAISSVLIIAALGFIGWKIYAKKDLEKLIDGPEMEVV
jgi:predicted negative regulator of RcsB-dependent stress response